MLLVEQKYKLYKNETKLKMEHPPHTFREKTSER